MKSPGYLYGVLAGLASLIPLPFVDDIVISIIHFVMGKHLLRAHPNPQDKKVQELWGSGNGWWSRFTNFLWSFPKKLIIKTVEKFFKTVLFWLAFRSAILQAIHTKMIYMASLSALKAGLLTLPQPDIDVAIKQIRKDHLPTGLKSGFEKSVAQLQTPSPVEISITDMVKSKQGGVA